jgi:glycosyltransferase involved in cell wall biosynthesis
MYTKNNTGRVVVASNIPHHAHTALALHEMGELKKYITSSVFGSRPSWYRVAPAGLRYLLDERTIPELDGYTHTHFSLELYRKIAARFLGQVRTINSYNTKFDQFVERVTPRTEVFHFVNGFGTTSAKKVKQLGSQLVVDERGEHPRFLERLLREEHRELGIPFDKDQQIYWEANHISGFELADRIIVPSQYSKMTLENEGISGDVIHVIPYGCAFMHNDRTISAARNVSSKKNVLNVLYVGGVIPRKGIIYLLRAAAIVRRHVKLVVRCIGPIDKAYFERLREYIVEGVEFLGPLPHHELTKHYLWADLFVMPSLSDSFNLATADAMSVGIPVIVTENVGISEYIHDGSNGWVVPTRDVVTLAERIASYSRQAVGAESNELLLSELSWKSYRARVRDFYANILK